MLYQIVKNPLSFFYHLGLEEELDLNQPVGIGEHSDVMGTIDGEINAIAQAHEKIEIINHYFLNR